MTDKYYGLDQKGVKFVISIYEHEPYSIRRLDLTNATELFVVFKKPDGTIIEREGQLNNPLTPDNSAISYTEPSDSDPYILDQVGDYVVYGKAVFSDKTLYSLVGGNVTVVNGGEGPKVYTLDPRFDDTNLISDKEELLPDDVDSAEDFILVWNRSENKLNQTRLQNAGNKGPKGDQGIQGLQGLQGIQGLKGDQGIQGLQGIQGSKGDTGLQGSKGDKGDTGSQGTAVINPGSIDSLPQTTPIGLDELLLLDKTDNTLKKSLFSNIPTGITENDINTASVVDPELTDKIPIINSSGDLEASEVSSILGEVNPYPTDNYELIPVTTSVNIDASKNQIRNYNITEDSDVKFTKFENGNVFILYVKNSTSTSKNLSFIDDIIWEKTNPNLNIEGYKTRRLNLEKVNDIIYGSYKDLEYEPKMYFLLTDGLNAYIRIYNLRYELIESYEITSSTESYYFISGNHDNLFLGSDYPENYEGVYKITNRNNQDFPAKEKILNSLLYNVTVWGKYLYFFSRRSGERSRSDLNGNNYVSLGVISLPTGIVATNTFYLTDDGFIISGQLSSGGEKHLLKYSLSGELLINRIVDFNFVIYHTSLFNKKLYATTYRRYDSTYEINTYDVDDDDFPIESTKTTIGTSEQLITDITIF